jgi:hypothetical protein
MANIVDTLRKFFKRAFKFRYGTAQADYDATLLDIYRRFHNLSFGRSFLTVQEVGLLEGPSYVRFAREFEMMDAYDIISAALDIYASEATFKDVRTGRSIWIESSDGEVKKILDALLERIDIEETVYEIARNVAKYGNDFNLIIFSKSDMYGEEGLKVEFLDFIHPLNVRVVEVDKNIYYLYIINPNLAETMTQMAAIERASKMLQEGRRRDDDCILYDEWNIIHFYLSSRQRSSFYGKSILEPVLVSWRRLVYLENAMWFRKLRESVSRYIYYVQIGEANVESVQARLQSFIDLIKTSVSFGKQLADFKFKYETWLEDEDLYIPVRSERDGTKIETLEPRQYDVMDEIDYFVSKIAGGLRIPKTYLLFQEQTDKTTLGMQDMRFAKAVMRLQQSIIRGIEKLCAIELLLHGYDPFKVDYKVKMAQPSVIFDLASWDAESQKYDVAEKMTRFFPNLWILKNFFGLSDEQIKEVQRLRKIEEGGSEEEEGGVGWSGLGGGFDWLGGGGFGKKAKKEEVEETVEEGEETTAVGAEEEEEEAGGGGETTPEETREQAGKEKEERGTE